MAFKILSRMGLFTGLTVCATHLGVWDNKNESSLFADCIKTQLKPIDLNTGPKIEAYNNAIKRGFYFAYRLPDWTTDFLKHTAEILNENVPKMTIKELYRSRDMPAFATSERNTLDCNPAMERPIRPLKIKDDITCRKRVLA